MPALDAEATIVESVESVLAQTVGELLDWIEQYNREDCHSTLLLRDWLLERRAECERQYDVEITWRPPGEAEGTDAQLEASAAVVALHDALLTGLSDDPAGWEPPSVRAGCWPS